MPKMQSLTETFNANVINPTVWGTYSGTPEVAGGQFTSTIESGAANYNGIQSVVPYDMTGSFVSSELTNAGNQALVSLEVYPLWIETDANNGAFFLVSGNVLYVFTRIGGSNNNVNTVAYSATEHRFFRFKEEDGLLFWQVSPDCVTWTTRHSAATSGLFSVTAMTVILLGGVYASEVSGTSVTWDNVNVRKSPSYSVFHKELRPAIFTPGRAR